MTKPQIKSRLIVVIVLGIIAAMAIFVYLMQVYQIPSAYLDELGEFAGTKQGLAIKLILSAIGPIIAILTLFTSVGKSTYSFIKSRLVGYRDTKEEVAPQAHHRHFLLNKVRNQWIDGILHNSLHNMAIIELGLDERRDKIELHSSLVVQQPNCDPRDLPSSARILDIFDELGGSFLILGEPGSGKTTILLQLAEKLLDRADADGDYPIPVIFNLSTWAIQRLPFEEWLVEDMQLQYGIGKTLGKKWVKDDLILLLLDGLDEVALEHREACVEAINHFRSEHGLMPLIVCSRTEEYDVLNSRLNLPTAILVKPLTRPQIKEFLEKIGASMEGVLAVLQDDEVLWELLYAPVMLNIVTLAFKDKPTEYIRGTGTIDERRKQIFDSYKEAMFDRPLRSTTRNYKYSRQQVEHWLSWLGKSMKVHNLSIFYLEHIRLDWLPSSQQKTLKIESILLVVLVFGLFTVLVRGLVLGLVFGLIGVLIVWPFGERFSVISQQKAERLQFNRSKMVFGLVFGLCVGLVLGLIGGLVYGLFGVLFSMLVLGLETKELDARRYPNEGIHRSAKNAIFIVLSSVLVFVLVCGPVVWLFGEPFSGLLGEPFSGQFGEPFSGLFGGVYSGLIFGLVAGLIGGLRFGGYECIQHYLLRIAFQRHNFAPLSYVDFLDYAADRIFLRKVGGGYVFIHRMILDYFASLEPG